jgi:hypothetical protein
MQRDGVRLRSYPLDGFSSVGDEISKDLQDIVKRLETEESEIGRQWCKSQFQSTLATAFTALQRTDEAQLIRRLIETGEIKTLDSESRQAAYDQMCSERTPEPDTSWLQRQLVQLAVEFQTHEPLMDEIENLRAGRSRRLEDWRRHFPELTDQPDETVALFSDAYTRIADGKSWSFEPPPATPALSNETLV